MICLIVLGSLEDLYCGAYPFLFALKSFARPVTVSSMAKYGLCLWTSPVRIDLIVDSFEVFRGTSAFSEMETLRRPFMASLYDGRAAIVDWVWGLLLNILKLWWGMSMVVVAFRWSESLDRWERWLYRRRSLTLYLPWLLHWRPAHMLADESMFECVWRS